MTKSLDWEKVVNSDAARDEMHRLVDELYDQHRYVTFSWHTGKQRTNKQNKSLHKFLGMLAEQLNDAGLDMRRVIKQDIDIPWSTQSAKDFLWRPVQQALLNKESTAEAERTEYNDVYEVLCRHLSDKFGITPPPWPQRDEDDE